MPVRQPGKHAMMFIFITVLIDMIGFGLIIPVMPDLIKGLTGQDAPNAAVMGGWLMTLYAGMQFVFAPIVGQIWAQAYFVDRVGWLHARLSDHGVFRLFPRFIYRSRDIRDFRGQLHNSQCLYRGHIE